MVASLVPRSMRIARGAALAVLVGLALAAPACAPAQTAYDVNLAPGFRGAGASVSVFGVFKEGRMNEDAWTEIAPRVSSAFGLHVCDAGYGDALRDLDPQRFEGIDEAARNTGIDEELLNPYAGYAAGDLILVIEMNGRVRTENESLRMHAQSTRRMAIPPGTMTASRGTGQFFGLEMAATIYRVATHEIVGRITMRYAGDDLDQGLRNFTEKLRAALPGAKCAPWKWGAVGAALPPARL